MVDDPAAGGSKLGGDRPRTTAHRVVLDEPAHHPLQIGVNRLYTIRPLIAHRVAHRSGDGQGQPGSSRPAGTSLQVHEGTARDGRGSKGTRPLRLLAARLSVRVPPPEPLTYCVRPVNTLIGRHVPDGYGVQLAAVDVDALEEIPHGRDPRRHKRRRLVRARPYGRRLRPDGSSGRRRCGRRSPRQVQLSPGERAVRAMRARGRSSAGATLK